MDGVLDAHSLCKPSLLPFTFSSIFASGDTLEGKKVFFDVTPSPQESFLTLYLITKGQSNFYSCGSQTSKQLLTTG